MTGRLKKGWPPFCKRTHKSWYSLVVIFYLSLFRSPVRPKLKSYSSQTLHAVYATSSREDPDERLGRSLEAKHINHCDRPQIPTLIITWTGSIPVSCIGMRPMLHPRSETTSWFSNRFHRTLPDKNHNSSATGTDFGDALCAFAPFNGFTVEEVRFSYPEQRVHETKLPNASTC